MEAVCLLLLCARMGQHRAFLIAYAYCHYIMSDGVEVISEVEEKYERLPLLYRLPQVVEPALVVARLEAPLLRVREHIQRERAPRSEERRVGKECRSRWSP